MATAPDTSIERQKELLEGATPEQLAFWHWQLEWLKTARPAQLPPDDDWIEFGARCGRGFGKTRMGAEWLGRTAWEGEPGLPYGVIAPTQRDVRFVCFEGESGLLNVIPPELIEQYASSDLYLRLKNGATIYGYSAEKSDRLRGPQNAALWCFVAGTLVATPAGDVPIERLRPGDVVLTRYGPRRVLANSTREAEVGEIGFSNGTKLVGTADHPVYSPQYGWTRMDRLAAGDEVCALSASSGAGSGGTAMVAAITSGRTRAGSLKRLFGSTARCGRRFAGRFQRNTTSTTSTRMLETTGSRTSSVCLAGITSATISGLNLARQSSIAATGPSSRCLVPTVGAPSRGSMSMAPLDAGSATVGRRSGDGCAPGSAPVAARSSRHGPALSVASVASTWRHMGRRSVYCLKVEDEPEYFANGILVHNCDEVAAWGLNAEETWDMAMFGLRLGPNPRLLWTSTLRPTAFVRKITAPKPRRMTIQGSTYDNRENLSDAFFEQVAQYEGTQLGRQELYGELIDPEEAGIIKRSWFRLWPAKKNLPVFDWIIMSLDTAYTEKALDAKGDPDPTACSVWGVFRHKDGKGRVSTNVMLLDCWEDWLGLPALMKRVRKEMRARYGGDEEKPLFAPMVGPSRMATTGHGVDILLIEDKGSGISLRQMLMENGIEAYAYNPGRADKLSRLHLVSPLFAQRRVWLPESEMNPGKPRTWCEPLVAQLCAFTGPGSVTHDDHVDACTQALRMCMDRGLVTLAPDRVAEREKAAQEFHMPPPEVVDNPYAL